ncbi:MAG: DegV family protein [Dehalococcoidia bacterium]|nr:MAG: DegV family protein [Dehalococcoidia bacterium]
MSNNVVIVTDTTACIPQEKVEQYNIELVPIEFIFGEKVYRDGIDMTPAQFYYQLQKTKKMPTTSGSLPNHYLEAYHRASRKTDSIVCITESSRFSGMFNSARLAMKMAREEFPDLNIELIECTTAAAGQGLVVLAAARAAAVAQSLTEVANIVKNLMHRVYLFASLDTLKYLVKGGRVPQAAALVNSLLNIKPVFSVNGGEAHTLALPRSTDSAMKHILKLMDDEIDKEQSIHVAIMHANVIKRAKLLERQISSRFNCIEIFITEFTPVMGVHTGPGVIGVAFYVEA